MLAITFQQVFMEKFDKIDNLFIEEFKDFQPSLSLEEIELMNKLIIKRNFYSFLPYQFNVYYASAIMMCLITNLTFAYNHLFSKSDNTFSNNYEIIEINKENKKNSIQRAIYNTTNKTDYKNTSNVNNQENRKKTLALQEDNQTNKITKENITISDFPQNESKTDSIRTDITKTITEEKSLNIIKPTKKIVYVTRKDTILQIDTVKTNRRRKK